METITDDFNHHPIPQIENNNTNSMNNDPKSGNSSG